MVIGGSQFRIYEPGITLSDANPIFLVPTDTVGGLSFTGIIRNVRVMGKFAPYLKVADTSYAENPLNGEYVMILDTVYHLKRQGEWDYYYDSGYCFHEYYDKGNLIDRDSLRYFFRGNRSGITVADSMARIRSIVDLYMKKGDGTGR